MRDLQPLTPLALERVVQTCLEKDPDKRWQSAREVKHALEWISAEPQPAPAPVRIPKLWQIATAALTLVAVVALWRHSAAGGNLFLDVAPLAEGARCRCAPGFLPGPQPRRNPLTSENEKLRRQNQRLQEELDKAHIIIDARKKVAKLLGHSIAETPDTEK